MSDKPKFVLTGGKMPTPPEGANHFTYISRFETFKPSEYLPIRLSVKEDLTWQCWDQRGRGADIIAVGWLP